MIEVPPDPYNEDAVAFATELTERGEVMRVNPGTVVTISPSKPRILGKGPEWQHSAVLINKLTTEEADWLRAYKIAADVKRRADRERERIERRSRGRS